MSVTFRVVFVAAIGFVTGSLVQQRVLVSALVSSLAFVVVTGILAALGFWELSGAPLWLSASFAALVSLPGILLGRLVVRAPAGMTVRLFFETLFSALGAVGILGLVIIFLQLEWAERQTWASVFMNWRLHSELLEELVRHRLFALLLFLALTGYIGELILSPHVQRLRR